MFVDSSTDYIILTLILSFNYTHYKECISY